MSSRTRGRLPKAAGSLVLAISLTLAGTAHAATVRAVQGQVLVSSGQGYRLVDGSTTLGVGGTVVANPGAVAHVVYPNGCQVTVEPGTVYQVGSDPSCQSGNPTKTGSLDAGTTSSSGVNPWLLAGGGVLIGGGVAALAGGGSSASP